MKELLVRLRGVLSLGAIAGVAGAAVGAAWAAVSSLISFGTVIGLSVLSQGVIWGLFGTFAGCGFGILLATAGAKRSLDEIAIWRAGLWGMVAGAAFPFAIIIPLDVSLVSLTAVLPYVGLFAGVGGIVGSGLIVAAKRAPADDLVAGDPETTLPGPK